MYKILANSLFIAKNVHFLPSCHSTNESASEMLKIGTLNNGDVVITDSQIRGKGQRGNSWEAEPGKNLTFSLLFRPNFLHASRQFDLNMAVSLGILKYLESYTSGIYIKWPNDIYYHNSKMCGILIQNSLKSSMIENSIIGIGLNINQMEFDEPKAISLSQIVEKHFQLSDELTLLLECIESEYLSLRNGLRKALKDRYLAKMLGYCEDRLFKSEGQIFKGRIVGVSDDGRLEIESIKGLQLFGFKEVEFL